MSLTFEQIMLTAYNEYFMLGQFRLANDGEGVYISQWSVPGVPQPSHSEVMDLDTPELELQFNVGQFTTNGKALLRQYMNDVARNRGYDSSSSCTSYINSTIPSWVEEATTFIAWRDAVLMYTMEQIELMRTSARTIPTFDQFKSELPVIQWP